MTTQLFEIVGEICRENDIVFGKGTYSTHNDFKGRGIVKSPIYLDARDVRRGKRYEILSLGKNMFTYNNLIDLPTDPENYWDENELLSPREIIKSLQKKSKEEAINVSYYLVEHFNPENFPAQWKHVKDIKVSEKMLEELENYRLKTIEVYEKGDFNKAFDTLRQFPGVKIPLNTLIPMAGLKVELPQLFSRKLGENMPPDIKRERHFPDIYKYWAEPKKRTHNPYKSSLKKF